jgi:hypothetical protein
LAAPPARARSRRCFVRGGEDLEVNAVIGYLFPFRHGQDALRQIREKFSNSVFSFLFWFHFRVSDVIFDFQIKPVTSGILFEMLGSSS